MCKVKLLIVIVLMSVFCSMSGQTNGSMLDNIDFNDNSLIGTDYLKNALVDYITLVENNTQIQTKQVYALILATDNILSRCVSSYPMYRFVYQYLIYGFSEMGANAVVDYMVGLPYLEYLNADAGQRNEMLRIAEAYRRVKIGSKAPDIQSVTINGQDFDLYDDDADYTVVLFWSYSCSHCRDLIKTFRYFVRKFDNVTLVTVNVSGDLKQVKRLLRRSRLTKQINICDGDGWESKIVDDYAIDMTPSIILLDKKKTIIAKPLSIKEIVSYIK